MQTAPPKPSKGRPTQRTIADLAKVTQATVSLALANDTSVSEKTRKRIRQIANDIGYAPDPYLSGLSAYRKRGGPPKFHGTLSWLSNYPRGTDWRKYAAFKGYFEGAQKRAVELGYQLDESCLMIEGMTPARMEQILLAKNIKGILVAPQPRPGVVLDFPFEHFSAVVFGYSLEAPQLHLVTLQQFRSMEMAFRKLLSLGYRRPGLALPIDSDRRADRNWSAAFWSEQRQLPAKDRVPLLLKQQLDPPMLAAWIKRHKPDVVISIDMKIYPKLQEAGFRVPDDLGLALLTVPDGGTFYSGIWENPEVIGAKAVEFLIDLVHRDERGIPEIPIAHLVGGTWVDGKTVRNLND